MALDKSLTPKRNTAQNNEQTQVDTFWDSLFVICGAATQQGIIPKLLSNEVAKMYQSIHLCNLNYLE